MATLEERWRGLPPERKALVDYCGPGELSIAGLLLLPGTSHLCPLSAGDLAPATLVPLRGLGREMLSMI
jgi:hypothetical protein